MFKIGFIGTGGISNSHLKGLKAREDVSVVALCDVNEENLKKCQKAYGGQVFTNFLEMLENVELDAVWICTPPQVREEPLVACAEKKIPVMCEKPVERSEEKATRIAAELKKRNGRVQIGYLFRSMPVTQELKKKMEDDKIHVVQSFYGCGMSLKKNLRSWFYDKDLSGGALVDQATHNFDLLRYLFGEVKEIQGMASNPVHKKEPGYTIDEALTLNFLFEDGTVGSHTHTWLGDGWRNEILLSGEKRLYRLSPGGKLAVEEGKNLETYKQSEHVNGKSGYDIENDVFLNMVASGDWSKNPSDYEDGLKSLQLTLACDRALTRVYSWKM